MCPFARDAACSLLIEFDGFLIAGCGVQLVTPGRASSLIEPTKCVRGVTIHVLVVTIYVLAITIHVSVVTIHVCVVQARVASGRFPLREPHINRLLIDC
jgi:hypothetical protein